MTTDFTLQALLVGIQTETLQAGRARIHRALLQPDRQAHVQRHAVAR